MSMTDLDLFPSDSDAMPEPQFTTARNGYNPREVEDFIRHMVDQIETLKGDTKRLERALRQAQAESASAAQHYATAKSEVYEEFAARMAELLRTADLQAERVKREADDEAAKQLAEAAQQAETTIRDATTEADRLKWEGHDAVRKAKVEAEQVVQEITSFRRSVRGELQALHDRLVTVVEELGATIDIPEVDTTNVQSIGAVSAGGDQSQGPQAPRVAQVQEAPEARDEITAGERAAVRAAQAAAQQKAEAKAAEAAAETAGAKHKDAPSPEAHDGASHGDEGAEAQGATSSPEASGAEEEAVAHDPGIPPAPMASSARDQEADDLLSTVQGFDLVLPEFSEGPEDES